MIKSSSLRKRVAAKSGAMETRDHSNGVSPKNHRSRGDFLKI